MRLYQSVKLKDRLIIYARLIFSVSPIIDILEKYLPKDGLIIELGCGYGIISHFLTFSYPKRKIIGFDLSSNRIESAKKTSTDNIQFLLADIRDAKIPKCDSIIIIDILYLLPYHDQEKVLIKCFEKLNQNGMLIIKDTDKSAIWKFRYTYIEEKIKTKLGLYGKEIKGISLNYRTKKDFSDLLKEIGFDVNIIHKKQILYPGIFYICQKK